MEVDYDSDCDVDDYDDDYIYADAGAFDLADELASGAIPDAPALYYRDDELDEYDNYNFWSEIEYGNGEIYDQEMSHQDQADGAKSSDKKQKSRAAGIKDTIKKIRLRGVQDYPTVLWMSSQEAFRLHPPCPVYDRPQQVTSLLPNWRQLLKARPAAFTTSYMAIHSAKAPKRDDDWEDVSEGSHEQKDDEEDEEEEGDDHDEDEDEDDGEDTGMQDIDPEMLKAALAAKLSASGMAGKDQSAMMEAMMQMLAGGGGAADGDLLESLTSTMLNQVTEEGGDSSMGQWLSAQGVSLQDDEEEDEDVTTGASKDSSPKDSVAETPAAPTSSDKPTEALLEPLSTGRKRKHPLSEEISQDQTTDATDPDPAPTRKRAKQDIAKPLLASSQPKASTRKSAVSQTKTKAAEEEPTAKTKTATTTKPKVETSKSTKSKPPIASTKEKTPSTDEPARPTTRKRKASDEQVSEGKPKRQLRNFAAPTASSQSKSAEAKASEPKTTRSGRARK
ncbi:hypothetical protein AUEXF2481DRAFT_31955 [Aureobasidium subglaciale EXF-2481]|uniref:Uncharacterized protein n=1 Tax=Aureobasidium subglaciale (strain EXF-2481) TaxID=1043005 RepID=A0A074Y4K4_AURSE|nr:uncharacterized protein AUEXF2481DRAFT_31955 [Aureobasidium subglaciale EXF-2481]KAI5210909.1 hypothetical protein E4T38_01954 [Aureobasidium subglaciale]KAI5229402.1 hypothetical protein E4T40_01526 [Aureobasidium subglaciale]KAI5232918.1 hypothetical protein E4T41_01952 [Aureobasidium subglaciale]KAI5266340.1 hypothetical protein E4T46_01523 [Aureobasidium subglaciale]KEQ92713.1 hypothetical protein AUEXF2481DRAFT_31955 [Aureobasidium subglaciale EXF-2481]